MPSILIVDDDPVIRNLLNQILEEFQESGVRLLSAENGETAIEIIKEEKLLSSAAIASQRAAELYGMQILAKDIADNKDNFTRFFVLSHEDSDPTGKDKTSIIFSAKHEPGSLYNALSEFAKRNINLTRIESRPTKKTAWEYNFYLDFEGHRTEPKCIETLKALEKYAIFIKILGSYPKAT